MHKKIARALIISSVSATTLLYASYYSDSKRGWFYYELYPENNTTLISEENKTKINERMNQDDIFISSIPLNNLELLTAEEFTNTLEKVKKIAVMNPTKRNVATFQIMNKWQVEQSEKFAKVWALNLLENPNLEFPEILTDKFGRDHLRDEKEADIKNFFDKNRENFSYVVFLSDVNKEANEKQSKIFDYINKDYNVNVEYVNVDERKDLVEKFKLTTSPENFFVYRNKDGEAVWHRVKAGLVNKDVIIKNTMFLFDNAIMEKDK